MRPTNHISEIALRRSVYKSTRRMSAGEYIANSRIAIIAVGTVMLIAVWIGLKAIEENR